MKIISGTIQRPVKLVIYGPEGIGKSTLASHAPNPLYIDTEGGTAHLNVRRVEKPKNWEELLNDIREISLSPTICGTLILDTADWAEQLCTDSVCSRNGKSSIEDFGYGKGYTLLAEEWQKLLHALDGVINAGINVILTAHAKMRKFEQPDETGSYDRWEMKLSKQIAPLVKEWCDALLFLNYKTYVVADKDGKKKAQGGKRVIYASHHPCWDAKNRHGLPDEMDMDYQKIAALFAEAKDPLQALIDRLKEAGVPCRVDGQDIYATDKEGNEHSFCLGTGEVILRNPANPEETFRKVINQDAFVKAMTIPNVTKIYFKE